MKFFWTTIVVAMWTALALAAQTLSYPPGVHTLPAVSVSDTAVWASATIDRSLMTDPALHVDLKITIPTVPEWFHQVGANGGVSKTGNKLGTAADLPPGKNRQLVGILTVTGGTLNLPKNIDLVVK
jgi:hypothetical protein